MIKIKYEKATGRKEIKQIPSPPTVYLDNWALNSFTACHTVGARFSNVLNKLGGTLAISMINLLEVVRRSDQKQVSSILSFVDSVDGVFIDFNPNRVISREKRARNIGKFICKNSPCADLGLLDHILCTHDPFKSVRVSEVFLQLQKEISDGTYVIQEHFERSLFPLITKARTGPFALSKAKNRFRNRNKKIKTKFPHTEDLLNQCIDYIVINETMKMGDKEWRDVFHVIVPVAYCDFVLIDKRWIAFIKSTGLKNPEIARVYNQAKLEQFLNDLEKFGANYDATKNQVKSRLCANLQEKILS